MGFISFIIALVVVAVAIIVASRRWKKKEPDWTLPKIGTWVGIALVAVAVLIIGLNSFYTQTPGEAIVVKSITGDVVTSTPNAGMHGKAPWNSTEVFDIRNQTIEMFSNAGGQGADGAALNVPLKGGANASVSITIVYSIQPDAVVEIYKAFTTQERLRDNALKANLRSAVRDETAKLEPLQIKEKRAALGTSIFTALTDEWAKYGVIVDQVNLGDISLDKSTEDAIAKVINAQQEVEQARANLEKSKITAEVTKTEAMAQADADQIIRCGARTERVKETINGVETEVVKTIPLTGDLCQNRLNEQVLTSKYIEALKEIASKQGNIIITDGKTVPMVTVPAPTTK